MVRRTQDDGFFRPYPIKIEKYPRSGHREDRRVRRGALAQFFGNGSLRFPIQPLLDHVDDDSADLRLEARNKTIKAQNQASV